jgi:cell division control protein 6
MIQNPEVFDEGHLPRRLLHRESETQQLFRAWSRCDDVLLEGSSGVGKTTLVQHSLRRFEKQNEFTETAQVRALGKTTAGVIRAVLEALPGPDPARTTPREDLCLELRERVEKPTVVVLDEADDLVETDALARLDDVDEIAVVVITHDADEWLSAADDDIRRRLHGRELSLDRFSTDELADILERRAEVGLRSGAVERDQLQEIADEVAGVARRGIQVLGCAAEEAHRRGHDSIRETDIERAYDLAEQRILEYNLRSLPFHHQFLYELIRSSAGIEAEDLHDWYDDLAEDVYTGRPMTPISKGDRRRKLRKLQDYDLIARTGASRGSEYYAVDAGVVPPLEIPVADQP